MSREFRLFLEDMRKACDTVMRIHNWGQPPMTVIGALMARRLRDHLSGLNHVMKVTASSVDGGLWTVDGSCCLSG